MHTIAVAQPVSTRLWSRLARWIRQTVNSLPDRYGAVDPAVIRIVRPL